MITTLLFDLDDTLLGNGMGVFLPAYFQLITEHFAGEPGAERLVTELIGATRAMIGNADPARSLDEVFSDCFSEAMGWKPEWWRPRLDDFYRQRYPELAALTRRRPAARESIAWAQEQGLEVAVTTSPLYPLSALKERLRWAGLDGFDFALITSMETSRFSKPHPEYFAEVLARLGRRPEQALVVGDDWERDVLPAAALGIPTFHITGEGPTATGAARSAPLPPLDRPLAGLEWVVAEPLGSGTLEDFSAWALGALPGLPEGAGAPGRALPYLLTGNLAGFHTALDGAPPEAWRARPAAGEWSLTELACHLRDVEREVNLPRLHALVEQANPFISGADTDPWAIERDYQSQDGPAAFEDFSRARRQAIAYLRSQPADNWSRTARHAIFGPTLLSEIVGWVMDHDRIHLDQVRRTRARV